MFYYSINDEKNAKSYVSYKQLVDKESKVTYGSQFDEHKYYGMG